MAEDAEWIAGVVRRMAEGAVAEWVAEVAESDRIQVPHTLSRREPMRISFQQV